MSDIPSDIPASFAQLEVSDAAIVHLVRLCNADTISHAYLFVGVSSSQAAAAAQAFAQTLVCVAGGCGVCNECTSVLRKTNPDVVEMYPQGAQGYLAEQARSILSVVARKPLRASKKVIILHDAHLLGKSAANALLKTLEEPPDDTVFILLAKNAESCLPTVRSRCQELLFRPLPRAIAQAQLCAYEKCSEEEAQLYLSACEGSISFARKVMHDANLQEIRLASLQAIEACFHASLFELLQKARAVCTLLEACEKSAFEAAEEKSSDEADFLSPAARKEVEKQHKRLAAQTKNRLALWCMHLMQGYVLDVSRAQHGASLIRARDWASSIMTHAPAVSDVYVLRTLDTMKSFQSYLEYNVSLEACFDAFLITTQDALLNKAHLY